MGKVVSLQGIGVGKVGSIVYSVTGGQMIARQYQPNVANPSTVAQVNQRARLKLASQLAAALAPVIAIPKQGLQSSRNLFIKKNFDQILANNGNAQIVYENIQLTNGNAGLPTILAARTDAGITVKLSESADAAVSRVVYILYKKTAEDQLMYIGSNIAETAGQNGTFDTLFPATDGDLIIWAYGMKDTTASAKAKYGDYYVSTGEDIAQLVMNRNIGAGEYQFTQTRGNTIFSQEEGTIQAGADEVMVYVGASGPGSVAIQGSTSPRKAVEIGSSVTVVATPNAECDFLGWQKRGQSNFWSLENPYTFTANELTDLVGVFDDPTSANSERSEGRGPGFDE